MTASPDSVVASAEPERRVATPRRYLMCPPDYFEVRYSINPWMDPRQTVDRALARRQWDALRETYLGLGHSVEILTAELDLADMVFAANGAIVVGGNALVARFAHPQRRAEETAHLRWLERAGVRRVAQALHVSEGEGDFLLAGDLLLAGSGFRTDPASHAEAQEFFGVPVVSLQLVDPRYYHLDAVLTVLDADNVTYYPRAFSAGSQQVLAQLFPDAVIAEERDAAVFGVNAVSDGRNVVLPANAAGLADALRTRGYRPIGVDVSELLKAGGGVKCCTLELY